MRSPWPTALLVVIALAPSMAFADSGPVVVAKGKGPTKGAAATIAKDLARELEKEGVSVIDPKAAGKKGKIDAKLAKAVGARFLVLIDAVPDKKKFKAQFSVVDVEEGGVLFDTTSEAYAGKGDAAKIAKSVVSDIAGAIKSAKPSSAPSRPPPAVDKRAPVASTGDDGEDEEEAAAPKTPAAAPAEDRAPKSAEPADPTPAPAPAKSAPPPSAPPPAAIAEPAPPASSSAIPMFEIGVGIGSQVSTAYTVLVGGTPTALAYTLSPLLMVGALARFQVPSTQLGIEANFSWSPVKYGLATTPPAVPANPAGSFLDIGLTVGWRFWLSGDGTHREGFALEPLAGFRYELLKVDPQEPAIVLSDSKIVPVFGARGVLGVSDSLIFDADFRIRLPLGYTESNKTTGTGGSGFGIMVGGGAKYWFGSTFGVGADLSYIYNSISFKGAGTRDRFMSDPEIVDASVASSNLRVTVGPLVAL